MEYLSFANGSQVVRLTGPDLDELISTPMPEQPGSEFYNFSIDRNGVVYGFDLGANERTVIALVKPRAEGLSLLTLQHIKNNFYEGQSRTLRELVAKYGKQQPPRRSIGVVAEWRRERGITKAVLSWGLPLLPVSARQLWPHLSWGDFH